MPEIDIGAELLLEIEKRYERGIAENKLFRDTAAKINLGRGSFHRANIYAKEAARELSKAFQSVLVPEALPEGRIFWNIAETAIRPPLEAVGLDVQQMTAKVIDMLNEKAGIGMKAAFPGINQDRIKGIMDAVTAQENALDAAPYLGEPVTNIMQHAVDDMARHNARTQYESGLQPKIIRSGCAKCCDWCAALEGTYDYPVKNPDVYRRHEFCKCTIEFQPSRSRSRQNVHTRTWSEPETLAARRSFGL